MKNGNRLPSVLRASGVPHELWGEHHTSGPWLNDGLNHIRDGHYVLGKSALLSLGWPRVSQSTCCRWRGDQFRRQRSQLTVAVHRY